MNTKLTLSLDKDVISKAKAYAKENKVSISYLVENFLLKITNEAPKPTINPGSIVSELSGIIELDQSVNNHKDDYIEYLNEKYK